MRRSVNVALVIAIAVSFLFPLIPPGVRQYSATGIEAAPQIPVTRVESIAFPSPIDTSLNVTEYPLVSRALMLSGGSTYASLADLNYDGRTDLLVAVSDSKIVSVFYRQADGKLTTYESFNISLMGNPVKVGETDVFAAGQLQIVVFEKSASDLDLDHIEIFNRTSPTQYDRIMDRQPFLANASDFLIGNFTGDGYPDFAITCSGINPSTTPGRVEVMQGFLYSSNILLRGGNGTNAIAAGDFDNDGLDELAVANYYDSNVLLYHQPFWDFMPAYAKLSLAGAPVDLAAGNFNGDSRIDLAVITQNPSELDFFYQSLGSLPEVPDYKVSLGLPPSRITAGDLNGDLKDDLAIVSRSANVTFGFYGPGTELWPSVPDFEFPVSGSPRSALIGDLDGDSRNDLAVASARADWSGSHIAIYPARSLAFSNSNATTWTGPSTTPSMIAVGDLNGDDVEDLVLMNRDAGTFDYVFSFNDIVRTVSLGYQPSYILVADFNDDGFSDVLTTMSGGLMVTVTFGGNPFPSSTTQLTCGGGIMDVALGDFNGDSLQDFVVATDDGRLDFFFNNGQPQPFGTPYEITPTLGAGIWSVTAGDFNSDGLTDIAYTRSIRKITILFQNPYVPFGPTSDSVTLSHSVGSDFTSIWSGDVTGDGKADIVAMRQSDPSMYLFDQTMFRSSPHPYGTLTFPEVPKFVSVLDATDRGYADVVAIFDSADLLFLYRQQGDGLPSTPSMTFVTGAGPNYATIGDGNRDHRGDLLVNEVGSHSVSVWEQINFPPVVHVGGPYEAREGDLLQLNGTVKTGTSEIPFMNYTWDFGDGSQPLVGRQPRPVHNYTAIGNYAITVTVRDPANLTSTDQTWVNVFDAYPHVAFSWAPLSPREGQLVNFTDHTYSFDGFGSIIWEIDGTEVGTGHNLSIEVQDGNHTVTLEVADLDGTIMNRSAVIEVKSSPPELRIDAPISADEGQPVTFSVLVDEWHGVPVDPIVSYEWDFSYVTGIFIPDPYVANRNTTSHVFSAESYPVVYRVAVRVTDIDGEVNVSTWDIAIFDVGPIANFTLSTSDPQEGVPFTFISRTVSFDGIVVWNWTLTYPDNSTRYFALDDAQMAAHPFSDLDDGNYSMSLRAMEEDGNVSMCNVSFHVREIPPFVSLTTLPVEGWDGYYEEFYNVTFVADVAGIDPAVKYEWDFDALGASFQADLITTVNSTEHIFEDVGNYTVKVRVTDSSGSFAVQSFFVEINNKPFVGSFDSLMRVSRNPQDTNIITFDFIIVLARYPDFTQAVLEFGDGVVQTIPANPNTPVTHIFVPGADYIVNVTITDDDGYSFRFSGVMWDKPPTIALINPKPNGVVRSGTSVLFSIIPGSTPIYYALYDIDNFGDQTFGEMYKIDTNGWVTWNHSIKVTVVDYGGNIVRYNTTVVIDDLSPHVQLSTKAVAYGGDKLNITIRVDDPNVVASGIFLHVKFQGESAYSTFTASKAKEGVFYSNINLPSKEGILEFNATVVDLAGNSATTPVYTIEVKLHLLDAVWPYLLTAAILSTLGTAGYFLREARIAVDETFVIYRDGRLISHATRRLKPGMDDQVLGSMFVAIQDFVKDSFKDVTSFTLRRLDFGDKSIVIEKGDHVYLAAVLHGTASRKVAYKMEKIVDAIEERFEEHLKEWDGDLDKVRGVNDIVKTLYSRMPALPGSLRTS